MEGGGQFSFYIRCALNYAMFDLAGGEGMSHAPIRLWVYYLFIYLFIIVLF